MNQPSLLKAERHEHSLGWHAHTPNGDVDFELRLVILGRPFTLKNSKRITTLVVRPKRQTRQRCPSCRAAVQVIPKVLPSAEAERYLGESILQLRAQWNRVFREPLPAERELNAAIKTYRATRHRNDASNLYQLPEDAMQAAGVLVNDFQIRSHDGSDRLYDPVNPRVEIVLTPYRGGGTPELDVNAPAEFEPAPAEVDF